MNVGGTLEELTRTLAARAELDLKREIQIAATAFGRRVKSAWFPSDAPIENGDDAAALESDGGYTLFAAEGMRADFVAADPWFAGFSSVMVNVNDIAAMGGRPWAVVDVLFRGTGAPARVLEGMAAASAAFGVPVVGGHTTPVDGATMLAVAVIGRAKRIISGAAARPGNTLLVAVDLKGSFRGPLAFNAATTASIRELRAKIAVLPELAEAGVVHAGKDISMAGLCGTVLMMNELSGTGAVLDLERVPAPPGVSALQWLTAFPSYGFALAAEPQAVDAVCARFDAVGVTCAAVGEVTDGAKLELSLGVERATYADLADGPLTGFGART
jgi:hypothetical protein